MHFSIAGLSIKLCGAIFLLMCLAGCAGNIAQRIFVVAPAPAHSSAALEEAFNKIALSSGYYATHAKDIGTIYDSHADTGERTLILDYKRSDNPSIALYVLRDMRGILTIIIEDSDLAPLPNALCKDYMDLFRKMQNQTDPNLVAEPYNGVNQECFDKW